MTVPEIMLYFDNSDVNVCEIIFETSVSQRGNWHTACLGNYI
jgi:hypothetical protein